MTTAQAAWMAHDKLVNALQLLKSAAIDLWDVRILMEDKCFSTEQFAEYVAIEESIYQDMLNLREYLGELRKEIGE